jgi:transposase
LQPTRRRTWAPRGQTPIHHCWARHDRLSVLGALTCSPQRRRLGFYFRLCTANIRTPDVLAFLTALQRQVRRPLLVVLDRWSVHRAAVGRLRRCRPPWLAGLCWLPPYAPELNPVEQSWNHTKYSDLANYVPDTVAQLHEAVGFSLASNHYQPALLRSFFRYAKLKL